MGTLEICCTSFASAKIAEENGASRIELCDNILEGGTTPSAGMIAKVKEELDIPVYVLIRPRGGDFFYSDDEFNVMQLDLAACLELGVDGIVSGALNEDLTIDEERTLVMAEMSHDADFTFHRAFDQVADQFTALEKLIDLGVPRVLTSGGAQDVAMGASQIGELIRQAAGEIQIMAGGGLNQENIRPLLELGCNEFHTTAKTWISRDLDIRVKLNALREIRENRFMQASPKEIKDLLDLIAAKDEE
jgi:copper homeostasis protein